MAFFNCFFNTSMQYFVDLTAVSSAHTETISKFVSCESSFICDEQHNTFSIHSVVTFSGHLTYCAFRKVQQQRSVFISVIIPSSQSLLTLSDPYRYAALFPFLLLLLFAQFSSFYEILIQTIIK